MYPGGPISLDGDAEARVAAWLPADRRAAVSRVSLSGTAGRLTLQSWTDRGLIADVHDPQPILRRAALYAREAPGRRSRARLERRLARLASEVARSGAWQVATYADCSLARPWARPGLCRLLADAPWAFDLVVVDGYPQLAAGRSDLQALLGQLASAGVQTVAAAPSPGRRAARLVGNLALSDLVVGAIR